jgi:hypothetical protein
MFSLKLFVIIALVGSLLTAGALQIKPVGAIDKQSFKQQLLDKILSEEEDSGNGDNETSARVKTSDNSTADVKDNAVKQLTSKKDSNTLPDIVAETSDRTNNIKSTAQKIRDEILNEAGVKLTNEEEKQVNQDDNKILGSSVSDSKQGNNCRSGDVLNGASNKKDLKILSKCEEVIGTVKHAKKMNDGDYKFALKVRDKYKYLINKINKKKTGGFLIVEIVPKDQKIKGVFKPKTGDKVDVWGAWVTDKPKGWHEIHPAWKVSKIK